MRCSISVFQRGVMSTFRLSICRSIVLLARECAFPESHSPQVLCHCLHHGRSKEGTKRTVLHDLGIATLPGLRSRSRSGAFFLSDRLLTGEEWGSAHGIGHMGMSGPLEKRGNRVCLKSPFSGHITKNAP